MFNVNSNRGHIIAPFTTASATPAESAWLELGAGIEDISDSSADSTSERFFYNGEHSNAVNRVTVAYDVSGVYASTDPAQKLIADMKLKTGNGRKVWHKVVSSDGTKQWVGHATVTDIIAGSGAAEVEEAFGCTITFNMTPVESAVGGGAGNADISLNSAPVNNKANKKEETK